MNVRIKIQNATNSGNRRGWTKLVTGVDKTKTNGYAFSGEFLPGDKEVDVPVGAVLVQQHPEGSVKHPWNSGHCYCVTESGELEQTHREDYDWSKDFLSFRDHVADVLNGQQDDAAGDDSTERERVAAVRQIIDLMRRNGIDIRELARSLDEDQIARSAALLETPESQSLNESPDF